jgi:hypothetical protein
MLHLRTVAIYLALGFPVTVSVADPGNCVLRFIERAAKATDKAWMWTFYKGYSKVLADARKSGKFGKVELSSDEIAIIERFLRNVESESGDPQMTFEVLNAVANAKGVTKQRFHDFFNEYQMLNHLKLNPNADLILTTASELNRLDPKISVIDAFNEFAPLIREPDGSHAAPSEVLKTRLKQMAQALKDRSGKRLMTVDTDKLVDKIVSSQDREILSQFWGYLKEQLKRSRNPFTIIIRRREGPGFTAVAVPRTLTRVGLGVERVVAGVLSLPHGVLNALLWPLRARTTWLAALALDTTVIWKAAVWRHGVRDQQIEDDKKEGARLTEKQLDEDVLKGANLAVYDLRFVYLMQRWEEEHKGEENFSLHETQQVFRYLNEYEDFYRYWRTLYKSNTPAARRKKLQSFSFLKAYEGDTRSFDLVMSSLDAQANYYATIHEVALQVEGGKVTPDSFARLSVQALVSPPEIQKYWRTVAAELSEQRLSPNHAKQYLQDGMRASANLAAGRSSYADFQSELAQMTRELETIMRTENEKQRKAP